mmetsp:Transcript_33454/g.57325  ORF Transcript_33454/g.57325 Transcript_33454/m.57325 type:complete len:231 (+) Transcript_33454:341-1033(+)
MAIEPPRQKSAPQTAAAKATLETAAKGRRSMRAICATVVIWYPLRNPILSTTMPQIILPSPENTAPMPPTSDKNWSSATTAAGFDIPNLLYRPMTVMPGVKAIRPITHSNENRLEVTACLNVAPGSSHTGSGDTGMFAGGVAVSPISQFSASLTVTGGFALISSEPSSDPAAYMSASFRSISPNSTPLWARPVATLLKTNAPEPNPKRMSPLIKPLLFGNHDHPAIIGVE